MRPTASFDLRRHIFFPVAEMNPAVIFGFLFIHTPVQSRFELCIAR